MASAMSAIVRLSPSTCSPSTKTDGVARDTGLGRRVACRVDPALERHVLDARAYVGLGRAGLDGEVDQVVVARERALLRRLVVEEQVVERLGHLGSGRVEHDGERVGGLGRVVVDALEEGQRAVLDAHLAGLDRCVELVADGELELAAERAEEVLVDDDLLGRVVLADAQAVGRGRALRRSVGLVRAQAGDEEVAADDQHEHTGDQAGAGQLLLALRGLASLLRLLLGTLGPGTPGVTLRLGRGLLLSGPVRALLLRHRGFLRIGRHGHRTGQGSGPGGWGTGPSRAPAASGGVRPARG